MEELNFVIRSSFDHSYWVIAELANVSTSPQGHMYMELVEKVDQKIQAKARANLWSYRRNQIIAAFEDITHESLKAGMKLMLQIKIEFHAVYGISLQVLDIDPAYSLGELERQKQESIKKLQEQGLLDFNKQYILPTAIQNIAVISSATAAGYQDFINQLESNQYGYKFHTTLFPALMQGEQAVESIINALRKTEEKEIAYDVLVLIRGGGSNLDLACFDDYRLNFELSQSIFPVLTGIGHERDLSVSDMVAHTRLKTPTAVAEFIISHNLFFENKAISIFDSISLMAQEIIGEEKSIIENKSRFIAQYSRKQILNEVNELQQCSFHINKASLELLHQNHSILSQKKNHLYYASKREKEREEYDLKHFFNQFKAKINKTINKNTDDLGKNKTKLLNTRSLLINQNYTLNHLNHMIKLSKPENILKRGFSITRQNGKAITKLQNIKEQQEVETELYEGSFKSKIIKK